MSILGQGRAFVGIVVGVGLLVVGGSIYDLLVHPVNSEWLILACLTLLSGSFTIKVPSIPARISVSETFVFTAVLLFGASAGTVIVAIETLVGSLGAKPSTRNPLRVAFNFSAAATSIWIASSAFYGVSGISPLHDQTVRLPEIVAPLALLTLLYFLLNSSLVAIALSFEKAMPAFDIWRKNFSWLSVNYFGGASVAALLVSYTKTVDLTALGIIVPLLIISYLTFKTSLGRLDDANRHIDQVNRMYLSTIETLATAIDAKDQVTHGHIRRVQKFALGLAEKLDVRDPLQLKALEAAALLHDMGKLVVPEHILNKPGRLTPAEFEKMKLHASVGAQILSSIEFPYPVVPMVRHHHECWDGTGYPDGLRATEIPLGARILAVVDCFDALTSDRPYRPSLEDDEALTILIRRRGSMYDPLVVDAFITFKDELVAAATEAGRHSIASQPLAVATRDQVATSLAGDRMTKAVDGDASLRETIEAVLKEVRTRTDSTIAVLYLRSSEQDELVAVGAYSQAWERLPHLHIPTGTRVSGWVAATGRPIVNADARLDVYDLAEFRARNLAKCACSPLLSKQGVAGVLAVYTSDARGYSERDGAYLDSVCRGLESSDFLALVDESLQRQHGPAHNPEAVH